MGCIGMQINNKMYHVINVMIEFQIEFSVSMNKSYI